MEKQPDAQPESSSSMIVVLAKSAANVRATVSFLERRGFAAKIAKSLNEAVEMFSKKQANKLLLSVNFNHPKVEMLPVLMNQSFQIETILFAEESDRKSQSRLSNAKTKHVLFGPVSGPVVMMKIRQIDRELNGDVDDSSSGGSTRANQGAQDQSDIKIGGRRANEDDGMVFSGRGPSEKVDVDRLMKSFDSDPTESSLSTDLERSGETYVAKGERSKVLESLQDDESSGGSASISQQAQNLRRGLDLGLTEKPRQSQPPRLIDPMSFQKPGVPTGTEGDPFETEFSFENSQSVSKSDGMIRKDAAKATRGLAQEQKKSAGQVSREAAAQAKQNAAKARASTAPKIHGALIEPVRELTDVEKAALEIESKIQTCLREALAIVAGAPTPHVFQLSEHKTATLVTLISSKLKCSFLVSLAYANYATSSELFHRIQIAFFSLMRDYGAEFNDSEIHSIRIDDMAVVNQVFDTSEFVVVRRSSDVEIGVALVYTLNPVAEMEPYDDNMLRVRLRDLPIDVPVTFSVFLHLRRNEKFVRYLKIGSSISERQVNRLEKFDVRALVDQQESEAYRRNFATRAIQSPKRRAS